ncbi:MAG: PAS domain-containing protein [Bdellovibrionaceae bacterium]|nr:PAS domain-containing protein [Pseudobdellovibrionaceae bacterium]
MSQEKFPLERVMIQGLRTGIYVLIVLLALFQHLFQEQFFNWALLKHFYIASILGLCVHVASLVFSRAFFERRALVALTFLMDLALLSYLLYQTELNQSIFLFLDLLVILVCGLVFGTRGALILAAGFSISTTLILALGPEMKSLTFFFLLILNNLAFFSVAGISGLLADQLEAQGLSLSALRKINESIVETIPTGLLTVAGDGRLIQINPGATMIFGDVDLETSSVGALVPGFDWKSALGKGKVEHLFQQGDDTKVFTVQVLPQNLPDQEAYLVLIEDQTQVRKLEYAVRQSEKLAAVGQLAAGIAHEIRNPLAGISGSIELLSEQAQNETDKKLNRIILKEIDRLNRLVGDFLDFAKPEKPPVDILDIAPMLNEVLDVVSRDPKLRQDVKVERHVGEGLRMRVHMDKLKQAILNIVINAYQAMEKSETANFKAKAEVRDGKVIVRFSDTGCGMDENTRKRMFEPFHTTKPKGTGLGLAITLKILELHRGQIFVESEKGKGTDFEVQFPLS